MRGQAEINGAVIYVSGRIEEMSIEIRQHQNLYFCAETQTGEAWCARLGPRLISFHGGIRTSLRSGFDMCADFIAFGCMGYPEMRVIFADPPYCLSYLDWRARL